MKSALILLLVVVVLLVLFVLGMALICFNDNDPDLDWYNSQPDKTNQP